MTPDEQPQPVAEVCGENRVSGYIAWTGVPLPYGTKLYAHPPTSAASQSDAVTPIPMFLNCPLCGQQHIDAPDELRGWSNPPHRSHLCAYCGTVWRPADVATTGVKAVETRGAGDTYPHRSSNRSTVT